MIKRSLFLSAILLIMIFSCHKVEEPFIKENLIPWSIVAFDKLERSPAERVDMIKKLGYNQYAFGGRLKHVKTMTEELKLAKAQGLKISAVCLYINNKDSIQNLKLANEAVFESLKTTQLSTQIWVGIDSQYFEGLMQAECLTKAKEMISYLSQRAKNLNCKIALYNHGGWYGDTKNQLEIIKQLPEHDIGIIYNFHHTHDQLDKYPEIIKSIEPYLWCVNLNGMRKEGPKIISIGQGTLEKKMIEVLLKEGYTGPFAILGHVKNEDVKQTLQRNFMGIQALFGDK